MAEIGHATTLGHAQSAPIADFRPVFGRMVALHGGIDTHMSTYSLTRIGTASVLAACIGLVAGCSRHGTGEATTTVRSDAKSCVVTKQRLSAGPVTFEIKNNGERSASYEVRGEGTDGAFTEKVAAARGVAAGGAATMSGKLATGQFQVRCLLASGEVPAVTIRTSVDGAAAPDLGPESIWRFTVTRDDTVNAPPPMRAEAGDLVTFALNNRSDRPVNLTVRAPDGQQTAAISADARTAPETNVVLGSAGTYTVRLGRTGERFSVDVAH